MRIVFLFSAICFGFPSLAVTVLSSPGCYRVQGELKKYNSPFASIQVQPGTRSSQLIHVRAFQDFILPGSAVETFVKIQVAGEVKGAIFREKIAELKKISINSNYYKNPWSLVEMKNCK